ncbi:uncharacterized protein LOC108027575 isoform X2 [Drosophila biarmipes]|nr:uncharacterized protein LOC108027575 isoform X2 [Drosophila biarmipes]
MRQALQEAAKPDTASKRKSRGGLGEHSLEDRRAHNGLLSGFVSKPGSRKHANLFSSSGASLSKFALRDCGTSDSLSGEDQRAHDDYLSGLNRPVSRKQAPCYIYTEDSDPAPLLEIGKNYLPSSSGRSAAVPDVDPRHSTGRYPNPTFPEPTCSWSRLTKSQQKPCSHNTSAAPAKSKGLPFESFTAPICQKRSRKKHQNPSDSDDSDLLVCIQSQSITTADRSPKIEQFVRHTTQENDQKIAVLKERKNKKTGRQILQDKKIEDQLASQSHKECKSFAPQILHDKNQIVKQISDQQEKDQFALRSLLGNKNNCQHVLQEKHQNVKIEAQDRTKNNFPH